MRIGNSGRNYKIGLNYTITCDYIGGIFYIFIIKLGLRIGVIIFLYNNVTIKEVFSYLKNQDQVMV